MATEQAQELALHGGWVPKAHVAGLALSLSLFVAGDPEPQSRPRGRVVVPKSGGKPWVQFYEEKKAQDWQETVALQTRAQIPQIDVDGEGDFTLPAKGRVLLSLRFNLQKPKSYPKSVVHHTKKPDVDNLAKAVMDGLVKGRIIEDDNLVTDLAVYKRYATPLHPVGVEIDLTVIRD